MRCNASERAHAGQLALLPIFSAAHLLGSFSNLVRVGQRRNRRGWYGCNSAVYECSVARGVAGILGAAAAGVALPLVAMKVIFNVEEVQTVNIQAHFKDDYDAQQRITPHPNILRILHYFTDTATAARLPDWDVDAEFIRESSLFVIYEHMDGGSLLQLINERKRDCRDQPPFFTDEDALDILIRVLRAVVHIGAQLCWVHLPSITR